MKSKGLNLDDDILKVIVHATSGNRKKEWAKDKWADIIQWLSDEKNVQVLFNGTKNDSLTYEEILSYLPNNGNDLKYPPINFCGEFSLRETLAFTEKTDLIVGCDSGNLHIAASVGVPVIGIYGPMNTEKWKAWADNSVVISLGLSCQPCGLKKKCKNDYSCIKDISVERVRKEIDVMLENIKQRVI